MPSGFWTQLVTSEEKLTHRRHSLNEATELVLRLVIWVSACPGLPQLYLPMSNAGLGADVDSLPYIGCWSADGQGKPAIGS